MQEASLTLSIIFITVGLILMNTNSIIRLLTNYDGEIAEIEELVDDGKYRVVVSKYPGVIDHLIVSSTHNNVPKGAKVMLKRTGFNKYKIELYITKL